VGGSDGGGGGGVCVCVCVCVCACVCGKTFSAGRAYLSVD